MCEKLCKLGAVEILSNQIEEVCSNSQDEAFVTIAAVGDIDFHAESLLALKRHGAPYLFENVNEILGLSDFRIGNLESVLVRAPYSLLGPKAYLISDLSAIDGLCEVGFDVLTFANNHTLDGGLDGLAETLTGLHRAGIATVGAGFNMSEARKPALLAGNGLTVRVHAYSFGTGQIARNSMAGCAEANLDDIIFDLQAIEPVAQIKIVCLHMDAEFQPLPAPDRVSFCRRIAESGAHIVLCHHPHVIQGLEVHRGSLIAYSLGNYVTPVSNYMRFHSDECHLSFQLIVKISRLGIKNIFVVPVVIDSDGRPCIAEGDDRQIIIDIINKRSFSLRNAFEINNCYKKFIKNYCKNLIRDIFWIIKNKNFEGLKICILDLINTPMKRRWMINCIFNNFNRKL